MKTKIVSLVSQASKPVYSVPNIPVANPDSFTRATEEHKMGAYMTGNPAGMTYTVDTAYNNRDLTKSYTERVTQSRGRQQDQVPYDRAGSTIKAQNAGIFDR